MRFPVDFMCRMLGVSRAGYYAWRNRGPSAHAVRDAELTEKIREVDEEQKHRCGIERILWKLQEDGLWTSERRVRRLARAAGVECVHPRPYVRTTLPDAQAREGLADLVDRDFRPAAADQLWVGDITYIHMFSGFAYLATVIDLFSNKVVGWMVADHMRTGLVLDALDMALAARRPGIGEAVMHTDRGTQYTSHAFRDRCLATAISSSAARGPAMTMRRRNHLTPRSRKSSSTSIYGEMPKRPGPRYSTTSSGTTTASGNSAAWGS